VRVVHRIIDLPIPRDPSSVDAGVSRACSVNRPAAAGMDPPRPVSAAVQMAVACECRQGGLVVL